MRLVSQAWQIARAEGGRLPPRIEPGLRCPKHPAHNLGAPPIAHHHPDRFEPPPAVITYAHSSSFAPSSHGQIRPPTRRSADEQLSIPPAPKTRDGLDTSVNSVLAVPFLDGLVRHT